MYNIYMSNYLMRYRIMVYERSRKKETSSSRKRVRLKENNELCNKASRNETFRNIIVEINIKINDRI